MMVFKGIENRKVYVVGDQNEEPNEVLKEANKRFKTSLNRLELKPYWMSGDFIYDYGMPVEEAHQIKAFQVFGVTTKSRK